MVFPFLQNDSFVVIARYDLRRTWRDLVVAVSVPSVLFLVSFVALCVIMQSVKVGDDTKMRCKYCMGNAETDFCEMTTTATTTSTAPVTNVTITTTATRGHGYDAPSPIGDDEVDDDARRDKEPLVRA